LTESSRRRAPPHLLVWATVAVPALARAALRWRDSRSIRFRPAFSADPCRLGRPIVIAYVATTEALKLVFYRRLAKRT
jgi:hypothetical protein